MATETITEKAVDQLDHLVEEDTAQLVVSAVDSDQDGKKDDPTSDDKLAKLLERVQQLEKSIEELQKKDVEETPEEMPEEEMPQEDTVSRPSFGSLPEVCLAPYDAMKLICNIVKDSEKLSSYAIVALYDVPASVVGNLEAWEKEPQAPDYLPSRVSINSQRIIELLKKITDTAMNEAPCVMMPPFKLFATYWTKIEDKLKELQDDFAKKYDHKWDATPENETPKPRPLEEDDTMKEVDKLGETQDIQHLQCLVGFMTKYLHAIPTLYERIRNRQIETISFNDLWHLFNPGDIIFSRASSGKSEQMAYQVLTVTKGRTNMKDARSDWSKSKDWGDRNDLKLQCFSLDYDGTKIDTREDMLFIKPFIGKKRIVDLDYYPKDFAVDKETEKNLLKRARHFIDGRYGHGRCDGITVRFEMERIDDEEVFVDFKTGYEELPAEWKEIERFGVVIPPDCESDETYEPTCGQLDCTSCANYVYLDEQVDIKRAEAARDKLPKSVPENEIKNLKLMPERLLLLPRHLLVYTLRNKKWHFIEVEDFKKIVVTPEKIRDGWNNLVIDQKKKRLLKAMVSDHINSTAMDSKANLPRSGVAIDIVRGKGRGRIVFLYGPPGVGKTSTAETISAFTSPPRPLYPITCGDLGSEPKAIQEALEGHFKLAHRWNCVLLLDEADVYLAERQHTDLDRNGIVSVFLRTLEYYSGILFLTSNRVGSIDPAFKSRIHMALRYRKIDLGSTLQIWDNILRGIDKDNDNPHVRVKIEYHREDLLEWAKKHFCRMEERELPTWNGRQIRNAFQSAIALASHDRLEKMRKLKITEEQVNKLKKQGLDKIGLLQKHFKEVSKIVQEFEDYLIECGKGEDKAEKEGLLAPEDSAVHAQAYGRGAYGTARVREQRTTVQTQAKSASRPHKQAQAAAAPAGSYKSVARHEVIKSRHDVTMATAPNKRGDDRDSDDTDEVSDVVSDAVDEDDVYLGVDARGIRVSGNQMEYGGDAGGVDDDDDDDGNGDDDDDEDDDNDGVVGKGHDIEYADEDGNDVEDADI